MRRRTLLAGSGVIGALGLSSLLTAQADTMSDVKKRGTLMIGCEAAYVPYESFKNGEIVGYDPGILAVIAPRLGVQPHFIDTAWAGIIPALYAGKFDVIVSAMTITEERAEKVLFSMPYADASNVILLRAGETKIKTADDLSGKIIGVQLGSAAAGIIKTFEAKLKAKGLAGYAGEKQYDHFPEAYQDLLNERVDAVVNSKSTLLVVMRDAPGRFKILPGISDIKAYFGMAFRKTDGDLRDFFNVQLAAMKQDGTLDKLQVKWFGSTMETPNTVPSVLPS